MSKKRRNTIDIPAAKKFLLEAYGLKSQVVNSYHLKVVHEEYFGVFDWYHTTGKLLVRYKNGDQKQVAIANDDESAAVAINRHVMRDLAKGKNYWDKQGAQAFRNTLATIGQGKVAVA